MPVDDAPGEADLARAEAVWLDAQPTEVAAARAHIRRLLTEHDVDADEYDAVELLVSELVTNVIQHSTSSRVGVRGLVDHDHVRVEVFEDEQSPTPVHAIGAPKAAPQDATHGRGIGILDVLATEWGVRRRNQLTAIWFVLDLPRRSPHAVLAADTAQSSLVASLQSALERSQMLLRMVEQLGRADTPDEIGDVITRTVRGYVGAVFSGIALPDPNGVTMRYRSLDPLPERTAVEWAAFPLDARFPVGAATVNSTAYFHRDAAEADRQFPGIAKHMDVAGAQSMAHLPLVVGGRAIGTLGLAWADAHEIDPDQRALLLIVAGYAAQALARR